MTKTVSAAEAQTNFLELLDDVAENKVEVLVTKDGEPVAMVVPLRNASRSLESMRSSGKIVGDIVEPLDESWEANE